MENNTSLQVQRTDDGNNLRVMLTKAAQSYCSFVPQTEEEKKELFNAMNNPANKLAENIGKTIEVKDIFAETCDFVDEETGTITSGIRIVLIDVNNQSYGCASMGIFSALKKLMDIYGEPTWNPPLPIKPKQIKKGKKSILTLEF